MVADSSSAPRSVGDGSSTAINGLVGGLAGSALSFVPFAAVLGGAIAGYLEGGTPSDGFKPGVIAGAIMFVPTALIGMFVLVLFGLYGTPSAIGIFGVIFVVFVFLYTVGLGVLGGYLGVYLKNEL